ncbi:hypothetical protein SAMN02745866_03249 [Alteromonadaceae bacterium Bs31]|nr:hypothetical protein SAMN02745866_03249 [Alteromonadaceae bacterium Bs31]
MKRLLIFICTLCFSANCFTLPPPDEKFKHKAAPLEVQSFALALQDHLNNGDLNYFFNVFDINAQIERISLRLLSELNKTDRETFASGPILPALLQPIRKNIPDRIKGNFSTIDSWHFVSYRKKQKTETLLFRAEIGDYIDYMDFAIKKEQGNWRIIGSFSHSKEVWMSEAIGEVAGIVMRSSIAKKEQNPLIMAAQNPEADILAIYDRLPKEEQNSEIIQKMLLGICSTHNNPALYAEAVKRIIPRSKKEQFSFAKYSYYYTSGNYPLALQAIQTFNKRIGGDAQTQIMEADTLHNMGEQKKSRKLLARILEKYPEDELPYYTTLMILASQNRYKDATLVLDVLRDDFGTELDFALLSDVEGMEGFLASPAFKAWSSL